MRCPRCGGEFRQDVVRCPDCLGDLVAVASWSDPAPRVSREASVVVLRTADPAALALARALLEEAGIPYSVRNERMIGLFPSALAGPTIDSKYRAAEIEILESALPRAGSLLHEVDGFVGGDV